MKKILIIISLLFFTFSCSLSQDSEKENLWDKKSPIVEIDTDNNQNIDANMEADAPSDIIKIFSLKDITAHDNADDCYTVIDWKIYDITNFFGKHPWWDANLLKLCWIDWTDMFTSKHGESEKAKMTRDGFYIWELSE